MASGQRIEGIAAVDYVLRPPDRRSTGRPFGRNRWKIDLIAGEQDTELETVSLADFVDRSPRGGRQLQQIIALLNGIK
jgi:hypothetical protein